MTRRATAAAVGYLTLAAAYVLGALIAWLVIGAPPFDAVAGDLTGAWMVALLLDAVAASLLAGWVCRRRSENRGGVIVLIAVLLGLWITVVVTDALIGPTPSGSAFLGRLFGTRSAELRLGAFLEGRPQMWFVMVSYALAVAGLLVGGRIAEGGRAATAAPPGAA